MNNSYNERSMKIIDLKKTILEDNDVDADRLREELKKKNVFYMNVMSSPGSGKTTTIVGTIERLRKHFNIGVMEADIDSSVDAEKMAAAGVTSIQVHTGGECAMDAHMTMQALDEFDTEGLDLLVMENVGNLVCPAETDTGASRNVVILSYPEGDDKPLKYPLMFSVCNVVLVNKIDTLKAFDFDMQKFTNHVKELNPNAIIMPISAKTGEGMEQFVTWLADERKKLTEKI